jgi:protein gp37
MGKNSSIEWTDHTFNPWWGCTKVSPGCENCYAEVWAKRVGEKIWGAEADRRFFTDKHWQEPLKWNSDAQSVKQRKRVFCASMGDVFEARGELDKWRNRLWEVISKTPWLDWLLLTKSPENIGDCVPWKQDWPPNVWLGTTVENQHYAIQRIPLILKYPAIRRFLSCEPLIGPVDLSAWIKSKASDMHSIDWVIAGGESGAHARPMLPSWARLLRDQCQAAQIPFHFKQWGHWTPTKETSSRMPLKSSVREFWDDVSGLIILMEPKGKKTAGRRLDGATWNQVPQDGK